MTTTYAQGTTAELLVLWREYPPDGPLVDVANLQITITRLATGTAVVGPTSIGVGHPATGTYTYSWAVSPIQEPGSYLVLWTGNDVATSGTVQASEVVTVVSTAGAGSPTGLCDSWEPTFTCALPVGAYAVTGSATTMAAEVLFALSGRRFSLCEMTIRPCRRDCFDSGWATGGWWEWGSYPRPALIRGQWYNIACGGCGGDCSCSSVSEVVLPGPVYDVVEVKVDGEILTEGTDYRLDNDRLLVRLGGEQWPTCNDLNLADTEVGTWSVTFRNGEPLTTLGQAAVGVLATEFTKLLLCDDSCQLPKPVQSISRQGVNITFLDPNEMFADRRTGLYLPDLFISTYNPHGLVRRAKVYDVDAPFPRRTNT